MPKGKQGFQKGNKYGHRKHTPEEIEKVRQAHLGLHHSDDSKERNRQKHLGKHASPRTEFKKGDNIGHPPYHTLEGNKKISDANKGRISNRKGVILSEATKQKLSDSHIKYKGEERERYLMDRKERISSEYRKWERAVLKKNDGKCYICGEKKNGKMEAHHLISWEYDKAHRYDIDNGVPLCVECHKRMRKGVKRRK